MEAARKTGAHPLETRRICSRSVCDICGTGTSWSLIKIVAGLIADCGREFLRGHDKPAVTADRDDRNVGSSHRRAQRGGEAPAERDVVRRVEELARAVRGPVGLE